MQSRTYAVEFQILGKRSLSLLSVGLVFLLSTVAATAQQVTLSTTSMKFGNQAVGTTSAVKKATLTNTGTATLDITSIAITGPFAQTNNCGSTVLAGKKCTISVTFSPTSTGTFTGTVTITDNATNSPQTISLSGNGVTRRLGHTHQVDVSDDEHWEHQCSHDSNPGEQQSHNAHDQQHYGERPVCPDQYLWQLVGFRH